MRSETAKFTARALAIAAGGILTAQVSAQLQVTNWLDGTSGNWGDVGRWDNGVPSNSGTTTYTANISVDGIYAVTLNNNFIVTNVNLDSAGSSAMLDLNNRSLTLRGGYTQVGNMLVDNGAVPRAGQLTIFGPAVLDNSTFQSARITTRGALTFQGAMNDICDTDMDHRGSVASWTGTGDISIDGMNGRFTNNVASTFTISNDQRVTSDTTQGRFVNLGRIVKSTGTFTTFFDTAVFENAGTLEIQTGTVRVGNLASATFSGGTLNTGVWKVMGTTLLLDTVSITTNNADVTLSGSGATFTSLTSNLATNGASGKLTFQNKNFITPGPFTNSGSLSALGASTVTVSGAFNSFAGGTLSPGAYNIQGSFLAPFGANVTTLGARVTLDGPASVFADTAGGADRISAVTTIQSTGELATANNRDYTSTALSLTLDPGARLTAGAGAMNLPNLTNLTGDTLTSGIYTVRGNLNLNGETNILTLATADVTLDGASAKISNETGAPNLMGAFTTIGTGSNLTLRGGQQLTTSGSVTVSSGATLNILGAGTRLTAAGFTPALGSTTTISGTLRFNNAAFTSVPSGVRIQPGGRVENQFGVDAFAALNSIPANAQFSIDSGETRTLLGNLTTDATGALTVGGGAAAATLNIPGNYLQNGATELNAGNLNVTGAYNLNGSTTGRGAITAGSIVMGPGGSLAPGFSPGQIDITGNVSISGEADFTMEIGAPDAVENRGVLNDFLSLTGDITHGTELTNFQAGLLRYNFISAFEPEVGDQFILAHATGVVTGQFTTAVPFNTGILASVAWVGQDLILTVTALPTPGAAMLLGMSGLFALRRRR